MIKTLQAGRALAAISVAAFHLSIMMGNERYGGEAVFREYTKLGNKGVDFFFVLSGFIILFSHLKDVDRPEFFSKYIYRRFIRLFPIYWLYTFVFVLVLKLVGGTDAKIPDTFADWLTALTLIRFTNGDFPLSQAWTLFHEIAFYAVFSVLIINRRIGLFILGIFIFVAIIFYQYPDDDARTPLNVYTAAYNLYFVFGMGAFWLYSKGGKGIFELTLGLFVSFAAIYTMPLPLNISPLFLVLGLSLLLSGVTKLESIGWVYVPTYIAFIGDASYSIYLTHLNFEGTLLKIATKADFKNVLGSGATFFVVLISTIILGCFAYYFVEKPLLLSIKQRIRIH
ncbi:MAG: hypothetical protein CTY19_02660 [Methylomonas sp.]|nr:MAG: hypothetical protein CTY19_02660 [Methylomonas sp.]